MADPPKFTSVDGITLQPGGPFSALTASMCPQDLIQKLGHIVSILLIFIYTRILRMFYKVSHWLMFIWFKAVFLNNFLSNAP